jgi:hypothetical protein
MNKVILPLLSFFLLIVSVSGQSTFDLSGKQFEQIDDIPSTTTLYFKSNSTASYVIVSTIGGKSYRDECYCSVTVSGNKINIHCICDDKEIYPDPIKDSFMYDEKNQILTSTSYRTVDGKYFIWKSK